MGITKLLNKFAMTQKITRITIEQENTVKICHSDICQKKWTLKTKQKKMFCPPITARVTEIIIIPACHVLEIASQ